MENTLLVALSRQMALERQIDVVANNVANVNTTGFKANKPLFEEFLTSGAREDNFTGRDRRVSFVQDRATYIDMSQGPTEQTNAPLDVAIDGNGFLAVQTPAGERYTRNGSMQINNRGQLVTSGGDIVLGASGPITFQPGDQEINISADGSVTVREGNKTNVDAVRGKLRLVSFNDPQRLQKAGLNLLSAPTGVTPQTDTASRLRQGTIEKSNVSAVAEMSRMMEIVRTYQSVSSMMQQQSDLRKTAIERLADTPV